MVETVSNILQIVVLCACIAAAEYHTGASKSRSWLLYGLFVLSFLLGDIWWILDLLFYDNSFYSIVPYINWKASILFLILLMNQQQDEAVRRPYGIGMWIIPVFCGAMCVYYMQFGAYIDNVLTAVLMAVLIWVTVRMLLDKRDKSEYASRNRALCLVVLLFCASEYIMWTASCLDYGNPLRYLYDVFSFVLTLCIVLFIPAMRKAVSGEE